VCVWCVRGYEGVSRVYFVSEVAQVEVNESKPLDQTAADMVHGGEVPSRVPDSIVCRTPGAYTRPLFGST
jgi:hypothetical protein